MSNFMISNNNKKMQVSSNNGNTFILNNKKVKIINGVFKNITGEVVYLNAQDNKGFSISKDICFYFSTILLTIEINNENKIIVDLNDVEFIQNKEAYPDELCEIRADDELKKYKEHKLIKNLEECIDTIKGILEDKE